MKLDEKTKARLRQSIRRYKSGCMILRCEWCGKVFTRARPNSNFECPCPKCHEPVMTVIGHTFKKKEV